MLSNWQIVLLDSGLWLVPLLSIVALAVFPWKHWDSLFIKHEAVRYKRGRSGDVDGDRAQGVRDRYRTF